MTQTSQRMTATQLAALPSDGKRYELMNGELRMMSPAGREHGRLAARLQIRLGSFVEEHGLGETYAAETGFLLSRNPDTVRAPDVAFVSRDRLAGYADEVGYLPLAPDLIAEVVSPNDSFADVEKKASNWLDAGTRIVLVVEPSTRTVREYRSRDHIRVLHGEDDIEGHDVLPGWRLPVAELFG